MPKCKDPFKVITRSKNKKKHTCPKCGEIEAIWDHSVKRFYCTNCDNQFTKREKL